MAVHRIIAKSYLDEYALSKLQAQVDLCRSQDYALRMEALVNTLKNHGVVGLTPLHDFKNAVSFIQQSGLGQVFEYSASSKLIWTRSIEPGLLGLFRKQISG